MIFQNELIKSLIANGHLTAIEDGDRVISYSELLHAANKISSFLIKQGLGKETIVGIDLQDRSSLICAIIGVLNSRCVFVPIDSSLPDGRLESMVNNLGLQHIISSVNVTGSEFLNRNNAIRKYYLEEIMQGDDEKAADQFPYPEFGEEDSIYIYFTSGTTGLPKGIIGRNKSLLQFVQWEIKEFALSAGMRVSQFVNPHFDAFLRDIFVPLLAGGTICLHPDEEDFFSPEKIVPWTDEQRINLIHCVPSVFRAINIPSLLPGHFSQLKYILLSGERIVPAELLGWYKIFDSRIQLVNLYGATETTMIRSFYKIRPEDAGSARIPIGYPIDDTELLVAMKDFAGQKGPGDLKPCNLLIPGDLYIISRYTAKGYLNAPELTRDRFIKINAGEPDETIAFKTGDTARILADGKIDLIGRDDRQVKIRGIRIEPDEIEGRLLRSGFIKNAVVVLNGETGNESLAAFIIRHDEVPPGFDTAGEAERYLKKHLPAYMIPSNIAEVSAYPLLRTGKINHQELLKSLVADKILPPENELEEKILYIWKQILGDKRVSVTDSFNRIGGNSLSIMRLIGILYKEFNIRISLSQLFDHLTIRQQAEFIKRADRDNLLVIPPAGRKAAYHLSSAQERMYYNYELNRQSTAYNLPIAWVIDGSYEKSNIEHALRMLIERHESLRTRFELSNHVITQIIEDHAGFVIEEITAPDIQSAITAFIRPFDLSKAPLLRCGILSSENKKILVVDTHHIICDGASQDILRSDFAALYNGAVTAPLSVQCKDHAEWEYNYKTTNEYIAHREFWLKSFEGPIPLLELPTTNAGLVDVSDAGGNIFFEIDSFTIKRIIEGFDKQEITTFSGLFAVYFLFLSQLTGQEDIVIGINTSGRMQEELEGVAGMFVKTLPIRYQIDTNLSFRKFAKRIHDWLIRAYDHQVYDLSDIVRDLSNRGPAPVTSVFDAMFVLQNFKKEVKGGGAFSEYNFENAVSKYPISLIAMEGDDSFYFRLEYSTEYFAKDDVEILVSQFKSMVTIISDNIDAITGDCISNSERVPHITDNDIVFKF